MFKYICKPPCNPLHLKALEARRSKQTDRVPARNATGKRAAAVEERSIIEQSLGMNETSILCKRVALQSKPVNAKAFHYARCYSSDTGNLITDNFASRRDRGGSALMPIELLTVTFIWRRVNMAPCQLIHCQAGIQWYQNLKNIEINWWRSWSILGCPSLSLDAE